MLKVTLIIAHNTSVPYFTWFARMANERKDVEFSFIALNDSRPIMYDEIETYNCKCFWINFNEKKRKRSMIFSFFKLLILLRKIKPDVVHTNLFDDSLPTLMAARFLRIKKRVITKQDTFFHWNFAPQWVWADKLNNFNATHIHAVSSNNQEFILNKEKAPSNKVFLVRNGFDFNDITRSNKKDIDYFKEKFNLQKKIVIGTVARFIEWKGHHLIIEAAKNLVAKYPNIIFLWVGYHPDNTYQKKLEAEILKNNLSEHIIIVGYLQRYMMPSFYKTLDIYLHPAINEPFGFAISEALMNKIPVITTRTGSSDLMEHLANGYIIEMNNSRNIEKGVEYYLENEKVRSQIAERGKEYALKELLFENMYLNYLAMYGI
jgi:glycosyltransferase involved in cell wall biosynthesis